MKKIITIFLGVCISIFFVSCSTPYYNQNSDLPNANNTKDFIHYEVEFDIPNEYTAYSTDNEFYTELITKRLSPPVILYCTDRRNFRNMNIMEKIRQKYTGFILQATM